MKKELKEKYEEVIPLGFVNEQFCSEFINQGFEAKNSYRLKENKGIKINEKIDYWISINQTVSNIIRDNVVNQ